MKEVGVRVALGRTVRAKYYVVDIRRKRGTYMARAQMPRRFTGTISVAGMYCNPFSCSHDLGLLMFG